MIIECTAAPDSNDTKFLENKIDEFNNVHWDVKDKIPLVATIKDESSQIIAGASSKTFGNWLLIDVLWVSETLRGQDIGSKILKQMESEAVKRDCTHALLDTLNFQARPFYEKHGYKVQWTQENYPTHGCKYFMVKELK